jgi:hypothetical protein
VSSRNVRSSANGRGGTRDGEAGTEEPTTEEARSKKLEVEVEAVSVSHDTDDPFRTGGVDSGADTSVCAGVDAVDRISVLSGSAHGVTTP